MCVHIDSKVFSARLCAVLVVGLCVALVPAGQSARASEILLRNDTLPATGTNSPVVGFIPGEQAASWLSVPSTGDLVGVQVQWDSLLGGNVNVLERFINIYAGGTFPTPGPLLAQINLPLLNDGSTNEIRHLDPGADNMPLQVPVTGGQTIVVALEFLNNNSGGNPFLSSVEADADGIQAGKNSIFAIPGGWAAANLVGVPGDFGLRAILQPVPEPMSGLVGAIGLAQFLLFTRRRPA